MRARLLTRMQQLFATTQVRRHLAACRYHLPQTLPSPQARRFERALMRHLWRGEFALALHAAEHLGVACQAGAQFWRELKLAAQQLQLEDEARSCAVRELHRQWEEALPRPVA